MPPTIPVDKECPFPDSHHKILSERFKGSIAMPCARGISTFRFWGWPLEAQELYLHLTECMHVRGNVPRQIVERVFERYKCLGQ
jgi:hypothetical protein